METGSDYWSGVVEENRDATDLEPWRAYMAAVYGGLVETWLPETTAGRCLKTDLFEEAVSRHHPLASLPRGGVGVDASLSVVDGARQRLAQAGQRYAIVAGDLRGLPFRENSFGGVLSGSSLDHFASDGELQVGLAELARILEPGGTLILTLDNPHDPNPRGTSIIRRYSSQRQQDGEGSHEREPASRSQTICSRRAASGRRR